jgi:exonuclease III
VCEHRIAAQRGGVIAVLVPGGNHQHAKPDDLRQANLLGWLEETAPDIVCLQELKAPDDKFPAAGIRAAGYGAIWPWV